MSLMEVKSFPHYYLNVIYYHIFREKLNRFIKTQGRIENQGFGCRGNPIGVLACGSDGFPISGLNGICENIEESQ